MQLLPVSRVTVHVSPILLLGGGPLHLLQAGRDTTDVWGHQYCACTALFIIYQVDCPGLGVFVSLCGLDQVRERNAWKTVGPILRFLSIECSHQEQCGSGECRICGRPGARRLPTDCPGAASKGPAVTLGDLVAGSSHMPVGTPEPPWQVEWGVEGGCK